MTRLEIYNQALSLLGLSATVVDLNENTPHANVLRLHYARLRDALLRGHPWNFAITRAVLVRLEDPPAFGWRYQFTLPSDYLMMAGCREKYVIEGGVLLSNAASVRAVYVRRMDQEGDEESFDALFLEALTYQLASASAMDLTGSQSLRDSLLYLSEANLSNARFRDSNEGNDNAEWEYDDDSLGLDTPLDGWSPLISIEDDGARLVLKVVDWSGGSGAKPSTGYVGPAGLVGSPGGAINIKGSQGVALRGYGAWTPLPSIVVDGSRRVLYIYDWIGGEGDKPSTGYVGAEGLEDLVADAVDLRGSVGAGNGDVVGPGVAVSNNLAAFNGTSGKLLKDSGIGLTALAGAIAKAAYLTITGAINLDTLAAAVAANTAKVSNVTHTGHVTGGDVLTIGPNVVTTAMMVSTGVTPGTYSNANITVGPDGRVTVASTGSGTNSVVPAGSVIPSGSSVTPSGWLVCDGAAVSRVTFAGLFAVIGTVFGGGDGSTTFNVPDCRGRVVAGKGTGSRLSFDGSVGATGGSAAHALTTAEIPAHSHSYTAPTGLVAVSTTSSGLTAVKNATTPTSSGSAGGGGAHNNVQPTIILNLIIKT